MSLTNDEPRKAASASRSQIFNKRISNDEYAYMEEKRYIDVNVSNLPGTGIMWRKRF